MVVIKTPTGMILSFTVARKKMSPLVFVFVFVFEAADRTDRKETLLTLSSWMRLGLPWVTGLSHTLPIPGSL